MNVSLDDILAYGKCPLRARYRRWGAVEPASLPEIVSRAIEVGVGAFLTEASRPDAPQKTNPIRCLSVAHAAYRTAIGRQPEAAREEGPSFLLRYNRGLIALNEFAAYFRPVFDAILFGASTMSIPVDDDSVYGLVTGLLLVNENGDPSEQELQVVHVSSHSKRPSTWDRFRMGFSYAAVRDSLGVASYRHLAVLHFNPEETSFKPTAISASDRAVFLSLARTAIAGMKAEIYPPQPSQAGCSVCPFSPTCDLRLAQPVVSEKLRRDFLLRHSAAELS